MKPNDIEIISVLCAMLALTGLGVTLVTLFLMYKIIVKEFEGVERLLMLILLMAIIIFIAIMLLIVCKIYPN